MSAYAAAAAWVIARLRNSEAVTGVIPPERIVEGYAPADTPYPLILVQPYTDPVDVNFNGSRALTQVELVVRVWDAAPASTGGSIAPILPVTLATGAALRLDRPEDTELGHISGCVRTAEAPVTDPRDDGTVARALGGRWTVTVTTTD